jgi:hypothetical protein
MSPSKILIPVASQASLHALDFAIVIAGQNSSYQPY